MSESTSAPSSSSNTISEGTTELIHGIDNVINTEVQFFSSATKRIDICMNAEQFNLREIVLNAIADCKSQLKQYDDSIRLALVSKEVIFIEADKTRITQVIYNLLNNAIKFTQGEKGEEQSIISVTLEKHENDENNKGVIVSTKDKGIGIAPEIMSRLFTKFATKSERGTGLGLFISKSIVEAHGGKIWAENNKEGRGATFSFSLPTINK